MSSKADGVIRILKKFSIHEQNNEPEVFGPRTVEILEKYISLQQPIRLVLPAFPLKNPNLEKVLGRKPDLGEVLALDRLEHLCTEIERAYEHGAELNIVSDGLVYGDLMGVSDEDSFAYGQALRNLAATKGFHRINFLRVQDILQPEKRVEIPRRTYLETVPVLRKELGSFLGPAFDVQHELDTNPDTQLTYRSFVDLLTKDMPWRRDFDQGFLEDKQRYDDEVRRLAIAMVERLVAYENLLRKSFPDFIRLSIHRSTGKEKIYIPLLPREGDCGKNPWNCCVARMANGEIRTGYLQDFSGDFDLVEHNGQPYYFVERSPSFT